MSISRRKFIELAASFGASLAFRSAYACASTTPWREQRDFYPQGVASGDPHPDSVILWTRRPPSKNNEARKLILEVAADPGFRRVVATARATLSPDADWTTRVLAAGLKPRRVTGTASPMNMVLVVESVARSRRRLKTTSAR